MLGKIPNDKIPTFLPLGRHPLKLKNPRVLHQLQGTPNLLKFMCLIMKFQCSNDFLLEAENSSQNTFDFHEDISGSKPNLGYQQTVKKANSLDEI